MNAKEKAYALGAGVLAGLTAIIFVVRPRVGNTVEVPARAIQRASGAALPLVSANERVAVRIASVQGDQMTGSFVGIVEGKDRVQEIRLPPVATPPVLTFTRADIVQKLS